MRVKDLRVLITGAASGAGRTIAEMLADADARVFVSDISGVSVADLSNARPDIRVVQADAYMSVVERTADLIWKCRHLRFFGTFSDLMLVLGDVCW